MLRANGPLSIQFLGKYCRRIAPSPRGRPNTFPARLCRKFMDAVPSVFSFMAVFILCYEVIGRSRMRTAFDLNQGKGEERGRPHPRVTN